MNAKPKNSVSHDSRLAEIIAAYLQAGEEGRAPSRDELLDRHPDLAPELAEFFTDQDQFDRAISPFTSGLPTTQFFGASSGPAAGSEGPLGRHFGDYELIEEIGRGGMGVVYKAQNARLDRTVALKMILAGHMATPADVHRFNAEVESAAHLDHPNIVPLYEVGEHEKQRYFVMKLIEGGSLSDNLTRFAKNPRAAAEVLRTISLAVHYAHQRGILHRDLKPANILIDQAGQPHVTDFGLAKRISGEPGYPSSSAIVGTPSYMAPEQASGNKSLSTAIDVYSLGAILYELLTGRSPFRADTPFATLLQVVQKEPERPGSINARIDRDLETICLKCLAKEPERRYRSAEALAEDLERWLGGEPIRARRAGILERIFKWARRKKLAAAFIALSATAVVATIAGLTVGILAVAREKSRKEQALDNYMAALRNEESALAEMRRNAYYQTIALAAPEIRANDVGRADRLLDSCPPDLRQWEWGALKRLAHAEQRTLNFPADPSATAFSRDGRLLATAGGALGEPGTIAFWDTGSGRLVRSFHGHDDAVSGLAFDPIGARLATAGVDRTVRIWDVASGRPIRTLRGHSLGASCVAFSPDGRLVASAGEDRTIRLWDAELGTELRTFDGHTASIWAIAFSPDGSLLASASGDRMIKVWNVGGGPELRTLVGHTGLVHGVAFSPDGRLVASAGYDSTARVWNAATGRELVAFRGHSRFVTGVSFSPDARHVASSSLDGTIMVWEAVTGEVVRTLRGHTGGVWGVDFGGDGRRLASFGEDRSVKLWGLPTLALGTALRAGFQPIRQMDLGASGRRLAILRGEPSVSIQPAVEVWDLSTGRSVMSYSTGSDRRGVIALSPDGSLIAVAAVDGYDDRVDVLTVDGGTVKWSLKRPRFPASEVAFSPDGRLLAIVGKARSALIWDMTGDRQVELRHEQSAEGADRSSSPRQLLFDPDGRSLALLDSDESDPSSQALTFFDAATGAARLTIRGATVPLAFSRDGRRLIALDPEKGGIEARVLDPADGHDLARLRGHTASIVAASFSRDGARIVTSSRDGTVKVWDSAGRELMTLPDSRRVPVKLEFGPDDTQLIGVDDGANVLIWEGSPFMPAHDFPPSADP